MRGDKVHRNGISKRWKEMVIKWVKHVAGCRGKPKGDSSKRFVRGDSHNRRHAILYDVAHEALKLEVQHRERDLERLVKLGWPFVWQEKFRKKVKMKVKKNIVKAFDDEEVVDEVTEKIVMAAEADPYYRELFDD